MSPEITGGFSPGPSDVKGSSGVPRYGRLARKVRRGYVVHTVQGTFVSDVLR